MHLSLLFANTYLLRIPLPGPLHRFGHLHAKPVVRERASEYGAALPEYDIAALAEVFRSDDLEAMLGSWAGPTTPDVALGPGSSASFGNASSGLVTLSAHRLVRSRTTVFPDQGSRWRDSDAWSSKGVMLTEIELPGVDGNLEVVSTHLIAGGDVRNTSAHRAATEQVRFDQVSAVVEAAANGHRIGNAAIVVGDFNVQGETEAGDRLSEVMRSAGYLDLWSEHGDGPGSTCDAVVVGNAITAPDPADPRFCLDPCAGHPDAERIDYAFLASTDGAAPPVTVRSMRRRVFPRADTAPNSDEMPYLSDHVALHLDLTVGS